MKEGKTCKICGKTFTRRNYMQKHMEHIHSKRYSCPKCFRYFSCPTEHSCATVNGKFVCYARNCSLRFSNGMAMRLHIRDHHRKMDEDCVGDVMKTKKGMKEIIQTLCKKINLLNNCFDELKYQVDAISSFLKTNESGFEKEKIKVSKSAEIISDIECQEEYEDIVYIDEEFQNEEDVDETSMSSSSLHEVASMSTTKSQNEPAIMQSVSTRNQMAYQTKQLNVPKSKSEPKLLTPITTVMPFKILPTTPTAPIIIKRPAQTISMSNTTKIGSTIITQIPASAVKFANSVNNLKFKESTSAVIALNKKKPTFTTPKSTKIDSPTPPLFLNIQYDTKTTVCETEDPKITFHFDTKPPDKMPNNFE